MVRLIYEVTLITIQRSKMPKRNKDPPRAKLTSMTVKTTSGRRNTFHWTHNELPILNCHNTRGYSFIKTVLSFIRSLFESFGEAREVHSIRMNFWHNIDLQCG